MKAIRIHSFGGPDVLKLEELPTPQPAAGEILVRARAIGVNPVDTYVRSGIYGARAFPFTPGLDAAGEVESIGAGVTRIKPKDRVYIYGSQSGSYAEYILCKEEHVHSLPSALSFAQGAALGAAYLTAAYALSIRGAARAGETVLIHGASGGVGVASIQVAKMLGLQVIATAGTEKGIALVKQEGAHHVLNHHTLGYMDEILKVTDGRGADLILEMLANENLGKDLKVLSRGGRVIVIGSRGPVTIDPRDTMGRQADIRGMSIMTAGLEELARAHAEIAKGLEKRVLEPVVGLEIPLAEASRAHEQVMRPGAYGKIVLIP